MTDAERLLIDLRTLNIRVRLEGDRIRCKAARGPIPNDLAQQIRALKPQLLDLLITEDQEIAWRVDAIGAGLLDNRPERTPGRCSWCRAAMPVQPSPKCGLCCLAAAQLVLARLDADATSQATYRESPVSPSESGIEQGRWDTSSLGKEAA